MQTVLVGAVESTAATLEALVRHGVPPAAVFTLPLSLAHRHSDFVDLRPTAAQSGVPIVEVRNVNDPESMDRLRGLQPRYVFVVGWSQICRREFLDTPSDGAIGFHPALLPADRGRAVIPWTILKRRPETGTTLFWMDEGMDSGDIIRQVRIEVARDETAATLYAKHIEALGRMLDVVIPQLRQGEAPRIKQDHSRATYCAKRTPADGLIDWQAAADEVWTHIRAVGDPYPGAFTFNQGRKLFIWEADYVGEAPYVGLPGQVQQVSEDGALVQCGDGRHVLVRTVQVEGEPRGTPKGVIRNHARLGIDWVGIIESLKGKEGA
jgi:methionyl-tRNA formyltransferase